MSKPEIVEKRPLAVPLVREALRKIRKRDNDELNFRAQRTEEYLNEVSVLKLKDAQELIEKLTGLEVPRLKQEHIHKLVDTLPRSEKQLKVVLQGTTVTVGPENLKKILAVIEEYAPKK